MENNAMKDILDSVAIHEKLVALREKAKEEYHTHTAFEANKELPESPRCVEQHTLDAYKAHQVYRLMNILIEFGKKTEGHDADIDSIYMDIGYLVR